MVSTGAKHYVSDIESLMQEWDFEKNDVLPQKVTCGSGKRIWWKCQNGHSYQQTVNKKVSRNAGSYDSGD